VSEDGKTYDLPGGAAKDCESRKEATIREVQEETGLTTKECQYLFDCSDSIQRDIKGGFFRNSHKVFLIKPSGTAQPRNEINHIAYTTDCNVNLSSATKKIINKYYKGSVNN
jgi:8-oxo-dGTP pyrophosphatase MutT (NUDIX family)